MRNETFAFEIERFYGHFVNELKLTNKSKYTIISYNTTIKSFIAFIRERSEEHTSELQSQR